MIFHNSFRGEDLSEWMIGCDKVESSETVATPKVLSGVKNKDIYGVLGIIFREHGIKNRESLKDFCVRNSNGVSKCDAIYKMVYEKLPGVLTMHADGEVAAQARIRWAYQAMLPGYSIYNEKKFPVVEDAGVEERVVQEPVVQEPVVQETEDEYDTEESDEDDEEEIVVKEIIIEGRTFYHAEEDNRLFDPDTQEMVGYYSDGRIVGV